MKNHIRTLKYFLIFTLLFSFYGCGSTGEKQKLKEKPNVVFFLVDDLGYSDVGCYGSDYYETPAIDKLGSEGVRFTQNYAASSVCSPTRASILTGKYPGRLHITHAIPVDGSARLIAKGVQPPLLDADYVKNLPLEEVTIAEALKSYGYKTGMIGKWHVGWDKEYFPEYQGFDVNKGGNGMGYPGRYFYPYEGKWRATPNDPYSEWNLFEEGEKGEYLTDRLTLEAEKFIRQNKDDPFFLYLSHYAVHTPIQAKDSLINKYQMKEKDEKKGHKKPAYAAMIESVDQSMEHIMALLKELDLEKNTIIVFTSDNGGAGGVTSNYPLRGNKGNFFEGGIRVPLIVKYPGKVIPGGESSLPVISPDLYPTILGLAKLPLIPSQHTDGIDFSPVLRGEEWTTDRKDLFWHLPNNIGPGPPNSAGPCSVIRSGDWKLIESFESGECELYNLNTDLEEKNDLAKEMPEKVKELQKKLAQWRENVNVQMPKVNPDYQKLP